MSNLITCNHLQAIEASARAAGISVTATGDWWGKGHQKNIYFNCVLARSRIERLFKLPPCVEWYEYDGRAAGHEAGFHCKQCSSVLVGGFAKYGGKRWPK
jgi:hypothetical protein